MILKVGAYKMKHLKNKNILISGAGIAGPAFAYFLITYGFKVTIVEKAPQIRSEGYKIDIRGKACEIVQKMQLDKILEKHIAGMKKAFFL